MNELPDKAAAAEIGLQIQGENGPVETDEAVGHLRNWYWGSKGAALLLGIDTTGSDIGLSLRPRYAQSVLTRSEAALLGISAPRFAVRVFLAERPDGRGRMYGFVNFRRLPALHRAIAEDCPDVDLQPEPDGEGFRETASYARRSIADSVLTPPAWAERYTYAAGNFYKLLAAYGELSTALAAKVPFLPYVQSLDFGSGQCASAVCFMATAILIDYVTKLAGVAEITALAYPSEQEAGRARGLDIRAIERFLRQVGLSAIEQRPAVRPKSVIELSQAERRDIEVALRSYIQSGMPVIIPVSVEKFLSRDSHLDRVESYLGPIFERTQIGADQWHVVLAVGYGPSGQQLVVQDPLTVPFLVRTLAHVLESGISNQLAPGVAGGRTEQSSAGLNMPVTPISVDVPLLYSRKAGEPTRIGLIGLSDGFRESWTGVMLTQDAHASRAFRLSRTPLPAALVTAFDGVEGRDWAEKILVEIWARESWHFDASSRPWVWIEQSQGLLFVWIAELRQAKPILEESYRTNRTGRRVPLWSPFLVAILAEDWDDNGEARRQWYDRGEYVGAAEAIQLPVAR